MELPTDQKVGDSSSSERASKVLVAACRSLGVPSGGSLVPIRIPIAVGMSSTYRDTTPVERRSKRGAGSLRERSPGVWEIRVVVGFDPGNGRSCQRSFTIHGDAEYAQRQRRELVDLWGVTRVAITSEGAQLTTADLLDRYRRAPHLWKPATMISHASVLKTLVADPIGATG